MHTLIIETLGHVSIRYDEIPVNNLLSARAKALIIYIQMTHYEHSRDELQHIFLGEIEPTSNFRRLLHEIRRALPCAFIITNQSVMIDPEIDGWLDAVLLEEQLPKLYHIPDANLTPEHIETIESLIALYKGEFLSGLLVDTVEFEFWRNIFARNLEALVVCGLDRVVDYYLNQGDYPIALQRARELLNLDSCRSESYRKMMMALAWMGQHRAAIKLYNTCVEKLAHEIGIQPSSETTHLFEEIKAGHFANID